MIDIRQSKQWGNYLAKLGWINEVVSDEKNGVQIRIRKIPLLGSSIKIQRPVKISRELLKEINVKLKKFRPLFVKLEPNFNVTNNDLITLINAGYQKDYWPLNVTKTIHIDLKKSKEDLLKSFSKDTRQSIRKSKKQKAKSKKFNFKYKNKENKKTLEDFYNLLKITGKRKNFFAPKFYDLKSKAESFGKDAYIVLAYAKLDTKLYSAKPGTDWPLGGSLVLIHDKVGYYTHAASTKEGQKLYAPYLVLWNVMKLCKDNGCDTLDLEGIYDERFKKFTKRWKNFTVFKKKWGGKIVEYPGSYTKFYNPLIKLLFKIERFIP